MQLHTAGHRQGVVAAPHHAAVEAGRATLAAGGNALEAMVAMAATIAAVYPHMTQIGGDGFWLVHEPSGRVRALMAPGRAGANARPELYREYETIPPRGALAALTVPGAISGWMLALEAAHAQGARLPLPDLLGPAIRHAKDGYTVTRSQARLTAEKLAELKDVPGFAQTFLVDGRPPDAGTTLKQPALAATLDHLAHAGLDDYYRGDVAREIAGDLDRVGSPVTRGDLERCRASLAEPLSIALEAGTVFNTPPPTQGLASLIILALFDRLRVPDSEGFDHVHGLIEATKRAFAVRDRAVTDPDRIKQPVDRYLDGRFLDGEALKIDRRKAAHWPAPYGEGDTVWMGAADASGLVVSYIQSLYWEFGSGIVTARDRRTHAKSRRQFFARTGRAECARARPVAVPYAQSGAHGARGRPHPCLRRHGRRWPAANAGRAVHPARAIPRPARARDRCPALAPGPDLGLDPYQSAHGIALRRSPRRAPAIGGSRR